jgi:8-oxo-dGTP diphosphatase
LTVTSIAEQLSKQLRKLSDEQQANAAVALLLKGKSNPSALFVKRVQNPKDPWSGQIALPGGKRDPKDNDLKETAIRETLEETNVNLDECVFLGVMNAKESTPRPDIRVLPFVVLLDYDPIITLNEKELEQHFWIPLQKLAKNRTKITLSFGETSAYVVDDKVIWGLTYRITEELLRILKL